MQANLNWLTDPEFFRVNRLDAHSDHICYASKEELDRGESSLYQSLDGCWKFAWSRNPGCRPENFWQEGYDDSAFGSVQSARHIWNCRAMVRSSTSIPCIHGMAVRISARRKSTGNGPACHAVTVP